MKRAFSIGLPSSIEQSARAFGMTILTALVASFGTVTLAAYGIGIRVLMLAVIPSMGLSVATSALVGQNIGARKMDRVVETNRLGSILAFVVLTISGAAMWFLARPISLAFVPDGGAAIDQAEQFIRIIGPTFGLMGWQMILSGTMRGAGDTKSPMYITIASQYLIQFPLAYLFAYTLEMGSVGIWWSFAATNVLSTVVVVLWFMRGGWKKVDLLGDAKERREVSEEIIADEGVAG